MIHFFFYHILKHSIACERLSFFFHPVIWIKWTLKYSLTKRSSNEGNTHTHSLSQHRNCNHINISKHQNLLIIQTNSNDCVAFRLLLFHSMHINRMKAYFIIIIFALTDVRQAQSKWRSDQREEGKKNSAHTLMFMPSQRLSTSHDTKWKLKFGVRKRRHFFSFLLFLLKLLFSCVDLLFIWLSVLIEFSILCQWFFHPSSFSLPFFFASQKCVHY